MARVPLLEGRVSPRVASDPGFTVATPPNFEDALARAAEDVQRQVLLVDQAERRQKYRDAQFEFTRDIQKWRLEEEENQREPETRPERFRSYFDERMQHYGGQLGDADREQWTRQTEVAYDPMFLSVQQQSVNARRDRLVAGLDGRSDELVAGYATMDPAVRQAALNSVLSEIDTLEASETLTSVQASDRRGDLHDRAMENLAEVTFAQNPEILVNAGEDDEFATMDPDRLVYWQARASDEIERRNEEARREAERTQRQFLAGLDQIVGAVGRGVTVSPALMAQYSDDRIEAIVIDAGDQALVKAQRDIAIAMSQDAGRIAVMSPGEFVEFRNGLEVSASTPALTASGAAIRGAEYERLEAVTEMWRRTQAARMEDPAGIAIRSNERLADAWAAFSEEPSEASWAEYSSIRDDVYREQGYDPTLQQRLLPASFAQTTAARMNDVWTGDPETVAATYNDFISGMDDTDAARATAELMAAGMNDGMAGLVFVRDNPAVQQHLVAVSRDRGLSWYNDANNLATADRNSVNDELSDLMEPFVRYAGAANGRLMTAMMEAAQILAYDYAAGGVGATDAARQGFAQAVANNFQAVEEGSLQGLVGTEQGLDAELAGLGADIWLGRNLNEDAAAAIVAPRHVVAHPAGGFTTVPSVIGGDEVTPETALSLSERFGFRDPVTNEALERYDTEDAALAAARSAFDALPEDAGNPDLVRVSDHIINHLVQPGTTQEDAQVLARQILDANAYFMIDGDNAVLVSDAMGLPVAVAGADGGPITVPLSVLTRIGTREATRQQVQNRNRTALPEQLNAEEGPGVPNAEVWGQD